MSLIVETWKGVRARAGAGAGVRIRNFGSSAGRQFNFGFSALGSGSTTLLKYTND